MEALRIAAVGASFHPPTCWSPVNDHRWIADADRGLFYVVDAVGPAYGGYYAPFGIDPGLATLDAAFDRRSVATGERSGNSAERLVLALQSAHHEMRRLASAYDQAFNARIRAGEHERLRAAMAAADEVRPVRWAQLAGGSLAHFSGSITACCLCDNNSVAIAQIGGCRAYRCRDGEAELLVPDHMLSTILATQGKEADIPDLHAGVVTSLLGASDELRLDQVTVSVERGDSILLCSHSVWSRCDPLLGDFCRRQLSVGDVEQLVMECALRENQDATMIAIQVS